MLKEGHKEPDHFNQVEEVYDFLKNNHQASFDFLDALPIILETPDHIFVHGGYDGSKSPEEDQLYFLKFDDFHKATSVQSKMVVVGHWPACLLRDDLMTNAPHFSSEKNIISIDGGLGVKSTGELNALIIQKKDDHITYQVIQENEFKQARIHQTRHYENDSSVYIDYPHFRVKVLKQDTETSLCIHEATNRSLRVLNELISETDKGTFLKMNYTNQFMNLETGTLVEVVISTEEFVLIKHNEAFGWLHKDQLTS